MLRAIIVALIGVGSGLIVGLAAAPTAAACPAADLSGHKRRLRRKPRRVTGERNRDL